jgi:vacuolar-type H+-ATPase subunit H
MRDVIQKVIAIETTAKQIVEAAKAEAEQILSDAHREAQDTMTRTLRDAHLESDRIIADATHEAEREKKENLSRITAEIESEVRLDQTAMQRVIEEVVRCVRGQR